MPLTATPQSATQKWLTNLSAAAPSMTAGAQAVQVAPGQSAAAAADKWLARVTASKQKFINNVSAVSLSQWQQAYINIGVPRVAQGAQAKQGKMQAFMSQFLPYLQTGLATIDKMPTNTLEDGIAKSAAMIRYNAKFVRNASAGG